MRRFFLAFAAFTALAVQASPSQALDGIGNTSTIKNKVEGVLAGQQRVLALGSEVYQNELLRTGDASDAKVIFLDDTNLSVGPRSEVALDRFVYDPDKAAGAVVVRTAKGIFRFVTGTQQPQNYLIATPVATIGVRGTIFDLLVLPDRITVILISGQIQVTTLRSQVVALTQPNTSLTVYLNGRVVGPSVWRGKVRVDFASATFPYFPPVTDAEKAASVARHAAVTGNPTYTTQSAPNYTPPRVTDRPVVTDKETRRRLRIDRHKIRDYSGVRHKRYEARHRTASYPRHRSYPKRRHY
jgi:hypothetical protein